MDDLAFFGYPTIEAIAMDIDEVHISVTFSWDLEKAEDLYEQWKILGVPVEVVHGDWIITEDDWNGEVIYECSVCREAFVTLDEAPMENLWKYCPNCGAKMDAERRTDGR